MLGLSVYLLLPMPLFDLMQCNAMPCRRNPQVFLTKTCEQVELVGGMGQSSLLNHKVRCCTV
jgi:hypothetical protein